MSSAATLATECRQRRLKGSGRGLVSQRRTLSDREAEVDSSPLDAVLPAGQLLHVAVAAVEKVPAAQRVQMEAPVVLIVRATSELWAERRQGGLKFTGWRVGSSKAHCANGRRRRGVGSSGTGRAVGACSCETTSLNFMLLEL